MPLCPIEGNKVVAAWPNDWTVAMKWNVQKRQPEKFRDRADTKKPVMQPPCEPTPETKKPITMDGLSERRFSADMVSADRGLL